MRAHLVNPLQETWNAMPQVLIAGSAGLLLLLIIQVVERKSSLPAEHVRKLAHLGAGGIALSTPLLFETHYPVFFVSAAFTATLAVSRRLGWLTCLGGQQGRGDGDIVFLWAAYLMFLIAEGDAVLFIAPVLVLTLADSTAAIVGKHYGRTKLPGPCSGRSIEGSVAFCITAFASTMLVVIPFTEVSLFYGIAVSGLVGIAAGTVEAVSPRGWDNLAIPIGALTVLEFLIR